MRSLTSLVGRNLAPSLAMAWSPFAVLVFGYLAFACTGDQEQVSRTLFLSILQRERTSKFFGRCSLRDCSQLPQQVIFHPSQAMLRPSVFVVSYFELFFHRSSTTSSLLQKTFPRQSFWVNKGGQSVCLRLIH